MIDTNGACDSLELRSKLPLAPLVSLGALDSTENGELMLDCTVTELINPSDEVSLTALEDDSWREVDVLSRFKLDIPLIESGVEIADSDRIAESCKDTIESKEVRLLHPDICVVAVRVEVVESP